MKNGLLLLIGIPLSLWLQFVSGIQNRPTPTACSQTSPVSSLSSSRILIFRNTGLTKSAVPCKIKLNPGKTYRLKNKSVLSIVPTSSPQKIKISLDKNHRSYTFDLPVQDTLFLKVGLHSGKAGAIPSSRYTPSLSLLPRKQAHSLLREKWAQKTLIRN